MRISAKRQLDWQLEFSNNNDTNRLTDFRGEARGVGAITLGSGEPLVLIPGLAGGAELVMPLAQQLSSRYRVIVPHVRGDRGYLGTNPGDLADLADDLAVTLDSLGLERPIVMGVSFGGAIALEYAVHYPQRVGGLALWGVEAKFRPTLGTTVLKRVLERYPLPSDNRFLNQFFNVLYGTKPEPSPLVDFVADSCWKTDQMVVCDRLARLETFDVSDRLWRIDAPTVVVAGSKDVVIPAKRQRVLADGISGASFAEVAGAGHIGFLTHADEVVAQVSDLVRKVRRSYC